MSIAVMICFARSGGTLLNQCLGCLPDTFVMSEVNPLGGGWGRGPIQFDTVKTQAENWYDIILKSNDFVESVLELEEYCKKNDQYIALRDWSFINFVPYKNNNWNPPNKLLILDSLKDKCKLIPFAFVRDSIDVWISMGLPSVKEFFNCYLKYVKHIIDNQILFFKYEDFCINPSVVLKYICRHTSLPYSDSYKNYASFKKVNGDIQNIEGSRGVLQGSIALIRRKRIPKEKILEIDQCNIMIEANRMLGYPTTYNSVNLENFFKWKLTNLKNWIRNLLRQ